MCIRDSQDTWPVTGHAFATLGWAPDGKVRGIYNVTTIAAGGGVQADFTVTGTIDVDADTNQAEYTATRSINTTFNNNNDTF